MLSLQVSTRRIPACSDLQRSQKARGYRPANQHEARRLQLKPHHKVACRALGDFRNEGRHEEFDLRDFVEASVDGVRKSEDSGRVVILRLDEGLPFANVLLVYVGEFEGDQLVLQMSNAKSNRPMTYDLAARMLLQMGCKVTKSAVTHLVGSTYHARVHWSVPSNGAHHTSASEFTVDARPSDAINFAVRFGAPIYVARSVAAKMARPASDITLRSESTSDIERSCREDVAHVPDPTLQLQLQLQLAISNESYVEAARLRREIDKMLTVDRALSLVVAIETALEDKRYEEAKRLRDQLRELRSLRTGPAV